MRLAEEIIKLPYITEKSNMEAAYGKYTFIVDKRATKTDIKNAVEHLFQVKVLKVNTANYQGKNKRMGVHEGRRPNWKKAVVKIDVEPKNESFFTEGGKQIANNKKYKTSIEEFGATQ